jgi:regulatory protein
MRVITDLQSQQHDPERVNVYLDGTFAFGASRLVTMAHGLSLGQQLNDEEVTALLRDETAERAYSAALNFLSYRPRSRRETENYFRKKKIDPEMVAAVLERLERVGLVDDRAFAAFWIENRQTFKPRGSWALRAEMRQKGLATDIIDDALEGLSDEEETAYEAAARKAHTLTLDHEPEFFRKLVAFLQRRGFPYDVSATVARRIYRERTQNDPPL